MFSPHAHVALALLVAGSTAFGKPAKPDSDMHKVLIELAGKGGKAIETLSPEEARKQPTPTDAVISLAKKENKMAQPKLANVREIQVQGAVGMIPARVYIPEGKQPMPVVVYFHGGGFVIATNDTYDATPRSLAEQTKMIFVSVEYRKAPEAKFPAAHDDAIAAYQWVLANAASFGGDPKKIAVAGESAGGNLALNVAIQARDKKIQAPAREVLVYPVAGNDMATDSYKDYAAAKPLNKPMMEWFVKQYTNTPADAADPRINLVAANLKGLSPVTIISAEIDPLKVDSDRLEQKLKESGVKVDHKVYNGVTHEFFGMASVVGEAKDAQKFASKELMKTFN